MSGLKSITKIINNNGKNVYEHGNFFILVNVDLHCALKTSYKTTSAQRNKKVSREKKTQQINPNGVPISPHLNQLLEERSEYLKAEVESGMLLPFLSMVLYSVGLDMLMHVTNGNGNGNQISQK